MLRPSLPMIRPFISSDGKTTVETVRSQVTSWEYLEIARESISLAFSSHFSSASSSLFFMKVAISLVIFCSTRFISSSRASAKDISATFWSSLMMESSLLWTSISFLSKACKRWSYISFLDSKASSLDCNDCSLLSIEASRWSNFFSSSTTVCFLSLISCSAAAFNSFVKVFASILASPFIILALFSASRIILFASFVAFFFLK